MAERKRSVDGGRDTDRVLADVEEGPALRGRKGGRLARIVGVRDELKRLFSRPGGLSRVRKRDKPEDEPGSRR